MKKLFTPLIGRFGNQLFQWCHVRRRAELEGATFCCPPWVGEKIFDIPPACRDTDGEHVGGYHQAQESLIYSRKWVLDTLRLRPEIKSKLDSFVPQGEVVAHLRRGDYAPLNYPIISKRSYEVAAERVHIAPSGIAWVSEETPLTHPEFAGDIAFLPDFYRMMRAHILLRANSSFSWWAGALGEALVFSPSIVGKAGGIESDCDFDWGNAQRLATLDFTTDLHLFKEEDRYRYDLAPESLVIDVGGYRGEFAFRIHQLKKCRVEVFEPILPWFNDIESFRQAVGVSGISVFNAAIGGQARTDTFHIKGDMTGLYADGDDTQLVNVVDVASVIRDREVALLKLNCEGSEYEILERILELGLHRRIRNLQVQFHRLGQDHERRYMAIREGLLKTHRLTFDEPWVWQNFEQRS